MRKQYNAIILLYYSNDCKTNDNITNTDTECTDEPKITQITAQILTIVYEYQRRKCILLQRRFSHVKLNIFKIWKRKQTVTYRRFSSLMTSHPP